MKPTATPPGYREGPAYYNDTDPFCCEWLQRLMDAGEIMPGTIDNRSITDVKPDDLAGYERVHFFAGIGGWELALRLAGWSGPVWTGSCPCQPYSSAGKRQGDADHRNLWPAFFRLIRECRPSVVFGEQVASAEVVGTQQEAAFVVAVQNGDYARANKLAKRLVASKGFHYGCRWLDGVFTDLEAAHYTCGACDLPAACVGAPHIRQRVFWLAYTEHSESRLRDGQEREAEQRRDRPAIDGKTGRLGHSISTRLAGRQSESGHDESQQSATERTGGWSDFRIVHCRDGKARRISAQSGDEPLAHGIPRNVGQLLPGLAGMAKAARRNRVGRLRGYGNAIVPQIAAEFLRAYMEVNE